MKIAINGQIVDTDLIFSVSEEIYEDGNEYCFDVNFFDERSITVSIYKRNMSNSDSCDKFNILRNRNDQNFSEEERITMKNLWDQISIENKTKIEKMRQDIVNIWSENQSKIPTFDIKKY